MSICSMDKSGIFENGFAGRQATAAQDLLGAEFQRWLITGPVISQRWNSLGAAICVTQSKNET